MKVPAELTDSWLEEAKVNCDTLREVAEYIAQRAAEWAAQQNSSSLLEFSADEYARGVREGAESALRQPVNMEPVAEIDVYVDEGGPCMTFIPKWYGHLINGTHSLYTAAQLAAARQQGAEEERKNANVWVAGIVAQRIAELEKSNAVLLEALKYHQEQTRPIQRTIDAIAAAEVKP